MIKEYIWYSHVGVEALNANMLNIRENFHAAAWEENAEDRLCLNLEHRCSAVYGLGERFDCVNQKGKEVHVEVTEKFCHQGGASYCPMPFFFTEQGLGVYIDTETVTDFSFCDPISITITRRTDGSIPAVYFWTGTPSEIVMAFAQKAGLPPAVPKWSFGPWMSANRWHTQEEIRGQLEQMEKQKIPHTVLVIEAWSDEATFYRFRDNGEWPDLEQMVQDLKQKGLHLILWQIPVIKKQGPDEVVCAQLKEDWKTAIEKGYCIFRTDGTPYTIPDGHWFAGSLLPDFSNPEAKKWWFDKRQYLLDLGVDGFKTDGGEFVLTDDVKSYDGRSGKELRNGFVLDYLSAYHEFTGSERILFSRAGYTGVQKFPMQWAGDQQSQWEELRHVLTAGLTIAMSGVPFWGFDIAGFAGPMPDPELYERSVQMAAFAPVMQWHSEPVGGQFQELMKSTDGVNDRSPWNMARMYKDAGLTDRMSFWFNLRMNLLPYIYQIAMESVRTGFPVMCHPILKFPEDSACAVIEDQFFLGDLLVAPVLEAGKCEREVYLPEGSWYSLWPMSVDAGPKQMLCLEGNRSVHIMCGRDRIPVLVRSGACIAVNLDDSLTLGSSVGNHTDRYEQLCFLLYGERGSGTFCDDLGNSCRITWNGDEVSIEKGAQMAPCRTIRM